MPFAPDILYAFARMGIEPTDDPEVPPKVLAQAESYRFTSRERLADLKRLVAFFAARHRFGPRDMSSDAIRKNYHHKVMQFHPDRTHGDALAEERLKSLNGAFALVKEMEREAHAYFQKSEAEREALAHEAREALAHEAGTATKQAKEPAPPQEQPKPHATSGAATPPQAVGVTYMAASIPRFIRTARLPYLPLQAIIASQKRGNLVYDVVMQPAKEWQRTKANLAAAQAGSIELTMTKMTPPYVPQDTRSFTAPPDATDPEQQAKEFFLAAFNPPG